MYISHNPKTTRCFTLSAMFTALAVLFLCASAFVPTGSGALFMLGSAMICGIVCECGVKFAFIGFAASSLLTLILAPDKTVPAMFILFAGWYPIAKLYIEKLRNRRREFAVKGAIAAAEGVLCFGLTHLFGVEFQWYWIFICAAAVIGYDLVLDIMIRIYYEKIRKHIK